MYPSSPQARPEQLLLLLHTQTCVTNAINKLRRSLGNQKGTDCVHSMNDERHDEGWGARKRWRGKHEWIKPGFGKQLV